MHGQPPRGLTPTGFRLVIIITILSVAHHVDHVLRGVTGWPFESGFNAFSGSLFVYPVIVLGVVLSRRGRVGSRFWIGLGGGGAMFVLAVHVGPWAGDDVTQFLDQYGSTMAGILALALLAAFFVALVTHVIHELGRIRSKGPREAQMRLR